MLFFGGNKKGVWYVKPVAVNSQSFFLGDPGETWWRQASWAEANSANSSIQYHSCIVHFHSCIFLDQVLISYRYWSCCSCWCSSCCCTWSLQKSIRLHCFKSDRDEIWHNCPSSQYMLIDLIGFLMQSRSFKMAAMMSFHTKVLSSAECMHNICPVHMQQRPPAPEPDP